MSVPNSPDFNYSGSFAFEIWVNPGTSQNATYVPIACNTLYPSTGWILATDVGGGLIFQTGNGVSNQGWAKTNSVSLTPNTWNHVAAVVAGGQKRLYLNGSLVATGGGAGNASTQSLTIGHCPGATVNPPAGFSFDHVAIYQRSLSDAEVAARFASPAIPAVPGPISQWRLDESSVSVPAVDDQGAHDGAYVGAPTVNLPGRLGTAMRVPAGSLQPPERTFGPGQGGLAKTFFETKSDPVNTLTGAFTHGETDLDLPSTGVPFALARSYTSADATVGKLGPGWMHAYEASLTVLGNGDIRARADQGQQVVFTALGGGAYQGEPGSTATVAAIAGGYRLETFEQVVYDFDTQGRLVGKQDRNGEGVTLAYDGSGRLATVTNAAGVAASFSYNANGQLSGVSVPDGRSVSYGYTAGRLSSFTDVRGKQWLYGYDAGGRLTTITDPLNHVQVTNVYDAATGRVTQQTDAVGEITTFAWDPATQIATVTDPRGKVWKDDYDNNVLVKLTDPLLKTTTFGTDGALNNTSVQSPTNETTTMTFDAAGNMLTATAPPSLGSAQKVFTYNANNDPLTVTDARGIVTEYTYTPAGNVESVTQGLVPQASYTYFPDGTVETSTDARGFTTNYTYDGAGNVASVTGPDADGPGPLGRPVTTFTYDSQGNVLTRVDPKGNVAGCGCAAQYTTTFTYNAAGQQLTETNPLGHITRNVYDDAGRLLSSEDARGGVTAYEYDNANRVVKVTAPDPDGPTNPLLSPVTTFTYDDAGNKLTETEPRGNVPGCSCAAQYTTTFAYDDANRLLSTTGPDPDGAGPLVAPVTTQTYDANGNLASTVEPRGNVAGANPDDYRTSFTYDAAGRLLTTTDPLGNVTTNDYDDVGNLSAVTDAKGHVTTYTYDYAGRILTVTAPDPDGVGGAFAPVTTYTYDAAGNRLTRVDANTRVTTWTYTPANQTGSMTLPDPDAAGSGQTPSVWSYSYDINGNLLAETDAVGNNTATVGDSTTTYGYDRANRLTSINYSDTTPDVSFTLDNNGNRTVMSDGSGTETRNYDFLDRVTSVVRNGTFSYAYDEAGNITRRTYPDTTVVDATFDRLGRLATVAQGGRVSTYGYDVASNPTTLTLPTANGHVETRSYDRAGRLNGVRAQKGAIVLADISYTRDPVGNPLTETRTGASPVSKTFQYDNMDRLTGVCFNATLCPGASDPFIRWTYDGVGNRLTEQRPAGTTSYTYDFMDRMLTAGATSYTYDRNGNQLTGGGRTLTYDLANRVRTLVQGSTTTTYSYDGDGKRLQASTGNQASAKTNFMWDTTTGLAELVLERNGNNALIRRYVNGLRPLFMSTSANSANYYHYDPVGSVRNVTNASGTTQLTYDYEPYGTMRASSGTLANPVKFTGQYHDPTSLYHLRARQYDTVLGRFTGVDPAGQAPAGQAISAYGYTGARPTVMIDPSGAVFTPADAAEDAAEDATSLEDVSRHLASAGGGGSDWQGKPTKVTLKESTTYYRIHGGASRKVGRWATPEIIGDPKQARNRLSLPPGNTASDITKVTLPAGTKILWGPAAPKPEWNTSGGGLQIEIRVSLKARWFGNTTPFTFGWWTRLGVRVGPVGPPRK